MNFNKSICVFLIAFAVLAGTVTIGRHHIAPQTTTVADGGQPPAPPMPWPRIA